MGKGKPEPEPKSEPKSEPEPKPEPKPEPTEKKEVVNPSTGEKENSEWQASVLRKLDSLAEKAEAQGKTIQEWGTKPPEKTEKPGGTSDPEEKGKREPLDEWSN